MPKVPTYGQQKVDKAPLPGVRKQQTDTAESLGAGVAEAQGREAQTIGAVAGGLGDLAGKAALDIHAREVDRADQIAALEFDRQLGELQLTLEQRVKQTRGKDALALHKDVLEAYDTEAGKVAAGLTTDRQRFAFERAKTERRLQLGGLINNHTTAEIDRYEEQETTAYLDTSVKAAVANANDHGRIAQELARQAAAVEAHGDRIGLGPEAKASLVAKMRSETHLGVLEQLLANDQDRQASIYFDEVKDQIAGDKLAGVTKALEEGSLRGESQRLADGIVRKGGTLADQRAAAREVKDAKLRDAVMERIEHEGTIRERQEREQHEALVTSGKNIIDTTGDWRRIPAGDWAKLTVGESGALKNYAENLAAGIPVKTDPHAYYLLSTMATSTDAKLRDQFLRTNLLGYVNRLSGSDLQHFMDAQGSVRKGDDAAADKLLSSTTNQNAMVDEALVGMGLDPTPPQPGATRFDKSNSERVGAYRRAVREAVTRLESTQGKPATDEQVQSVVDQLRAPTGRRDAGHFWNTELKAYAFEVAQAKVAAVDDVPAAERRKIEAALRKHGRPVTDAAILGLFNLNLSYTRGDR